MIYSETCVFGTPWDQSQVVADPPMFTEGTSPLQTLEGHSILIIIPLTLSTKAVIQLHKDPLHEYHL